MAMLQAVDGVLRLTAAEECSAQIDPWIEYNSSLWMLCISPYTSSKLQALVMSLLQLHHTFQATIYQYTVHINPELSYVVQPLSSAINNLATSEAVDFPMGREQSNNWLIRVMHTQAELIETDLRCHHWVWIDQDVEKIIQLYVRLTGLFHQLAISLRGCEPSMEERVYLSLRELTTETPDKEYPPASRDDGPAMMTPPQEDVIAPLNTHISDEKPLQPVLQGEKLTQELLSSKDLSADQIFQALVHRGCQDLTSAIDTSSFTPGVVAGGNFGDIWKGKLNNETEVAIKVWRLSWLAADSHKSLKRLTREIYNWSKAKHVNIHQLLGVMMFQGRVGMVSRWIPNGNLQEYLLRNKGADRYQLCAQVSKGVQYLHANGMVHGDLKATNILVSSDGVAMLTDFDHSIISDCSLVFSVTTQNGGGTLR
ncbi:unnamed protein product [Rhizoctonia solani]|uniref:Protein kinase domain-containing protein n=1 Tax=Rhizoctonia solani TaxID=456999 RepID=A0A8H3HG17_9AGAM|nr:unnamed protein product [Rhizoctonia solani]